MTTAGACGRIVPLCPRQRLRAHQEGERRQVAKVVECNKINSVPDCTHVIRAETEPEVLRLAEEHTRSHGLPPNAQLVIKVKARIRDE
jgi:predicted small metal-binding protein